MLQFKCNTAPTSRKSALYIIYHGALSHPDASTPLDHSVHTYLLSPWSYWYEFGLIHEIMGKKLAMSYYSYFKLHNWGHTNIGVADSTTAETSSSSSQTAIGSKKLEETSIVKVQKLDKNCRQQVSTISPDTAEPNASPVRLVFQGNFFFILYKQFFL